MRLFIAEKPELAKAIVEGLGGGKRKEGYFDCGNDYVTWCFGHMLQLLDPEDYDQRYATWRLDDLPIFHIPWRRKPSEDKKIQLKIIVELLRGADSVVHAGDPDDEGQLLIDEILQYANCKLPTKRILINDNNTRVVQKALNNLQDNSNFSGLSASAESRSVGDQLYGYNLTRAYTLSAREAGYSGVLSVGRVQTPILGLVVRRDREFESHVKGYYYNIVGQFKFNDISFPARYQVCEGDCIDEKNRLSDKAQAQAIANSAKEKPARLLSVDTKKKEQNAPLPYNLLKLQTDASRKFGLKPDQVKNITQILREKHRLITYNRSDCEYLSEEQHTDAPNVLAAIAKTAPDLAMAIQTADPSIKGRVFDSTKVIAHHAIIPTEATADLASLSIDEQRIYMLIARAYIAQFWPKYCYDQTNVAIDVEKRRFTCRSNITTQAGWLLLYKDQENNEVSQEDENDITLDLCTLKTDQQGDCLDASANEMETKPKPLYTMATLLTDLTRVAKYIRDDRLRKLLQEKDGGKEGEHGGIGTPATRDSIISTLFKREYLVEKGKNITSTPTARKFYDILPDQAKYPDMTALWHEQQKSIASGERDKLSFIQELTEYISGEVVAVKKNGIGIKVDTRPCPSCQKPLRRIKGTKGFFWGCTGYSGGCKFSCEDKSGKPVQNKTSSKDVKNSENFPCTECGKSLVRREGKKSAAYWWGCSGYPLCKKTYRDIKGKPEMSINTD